jgi:L-amino acid N-acyltransferase YncA
MIFSENRYPLFGIMLYHQGCPPISRPFAPMTDIAIRPVSPRDLAAITRIYDHAVRHGTASFEIEPPDVAEMARRQDALLAGGFPYLVAERNGGIAGYAYAGPYRARPAYRWSVEDSIYIDPQMQGRGIGRALLERLLAEAETRGFRQMIAVIGDSANAPSIELHRAAGFRMVGTFDNVGFKFGRWLDSVLMQRPLGDGAVTTP